MTMAKWREVDTIVERAFTDLGITQPPFPLLPLLRLLGEVRFVPQRELTLVPGEKVSARWDDQTREFFLDERLRDKHRRREARWVAAHEAAHAILGHAGLQTSRSREFKALKQEADRGAGRILVPTFALRRYVEVGRTDVTELAGLFGVSETVMEIAVSRLRRESDDRQRFVYTGRHKFNSFVWKIGSAFDPEQRCEDQKLTCTGAMPGNESLEWKFQQEHQDDAIPGMAANTAGLIEWFFGTERFLSFAANFPTMEVAA